MNTGSALSISVEKQRLELLTKAVRFISCGKLKRGSQLLAEATWQGESEDMRAMIMECRSLGLLVQTRRCLRKADDLLLSGAYEDSLECYDKVPAAIIPAELSFQVHHNKGVCLVRLGRYQEAVNCLQEARALMPENSVALQNLAFALMLNHEYEAALVVFADVIRNDDIPPTSLLHVLYGSAECRQRLQSNAEPAGHQDVGDTQNIGAAVDSDPQSDNDSYNDYPLGPDFGLNIQNIAHHREVHADRPATATATETGKAQELARTYVPFRRLQYRAASAEHKHPLSEEPPSVSLPVEKAEYTGKTIGSPSAILSREKREQLRRAVNSYDRSALSSASTDAGLVNAQMHTLPPRIRSTDPSPGISPQLTQLGPSQSTNVESTDTHRFAALSIGSTTSTTDHTTASAGGHKMHAVTLLEAAESVSSAKPVLSSHRRRPAYFDFKLAVPSAPSSPVSAAPTESSRTAESRPVSFLSATAAPVGVVSSMASLPKMQRRCASQDLVALAERASTATTTANTASTAAGEALQRSAVPSVSALVSAEKWMSSATEHTSQVEVEEEKGPSASSQFVEAASATHPSSHAMALSDKPARKQNFQHPATTDDEVKSLTHHIVETVGAATQAPTSAWSVMEPLSASLATDTAGTFGTVYSVTLPDLVSVEATTAPAPSDVQVSSKPSRAARPLELPSAHLTAVDVDNGAPQRQPASVSYVPSSTSMDRVQVEAGPVLAALSVSQPAGVLHGPSDQAATSLVPVRHTADIPPWAGEEPADRSASGAAPYNSLCHSSNTSISGISGDSMLNSSMISAYIRGNEAYIHHTSVNGEVSEQQQEINRVFETRRYVDEYTFTSLDVMRMRREQANSTSTPPTSVTQFYPLATLQSPGPFPSDVDVRFREYYLSEEEFRSLFRCSKSAWENIPPWRQRNLKKAFKLF